MFSTAQNTQIHRVGLRREEGGDRGDLGEKKESQKGERIIKLVITLLSKNGYWRLDSQMYKIDNKYYKAKIKNLEERLDSQKYNIKKKSQKW